MVTGVDLIKEQIKLHRVLSCRALRIRCLASVTQSNAASMPKTQTRFPAQRRQDHPYVRTRRLRVRFDSHAYTGYTVPPNYDSMIGKLIVHRPTRDEPSQPCDELCWNCRSKGSRPQLLSSKKCSNILCFSKALGYEVRRSRIDQELTFIVPLLAHRSRRRSFCVSLSVASFTTHPICSI